MRTSHLICPVEPGGSWEAPSSIMKPMEAFMAKIEKRERKGEAFYRELRDLCARSGKSQREFAEERGIPPGTLSGWFFKLRRLDAARGRERKPRAGSPRDARATGTGAPAGRPPFLPVKVVEPMPVPRCGSGYELVLGKGVLRLPVDFDPLRVGALLRAVEVVC